MKFQRPKLYRNWRVLRNFVKIPKIIKNLWWSKNSLSRYDTIRVLNFGKNEINFRYSSVFPNQNFEENRRYRKLKLWNFAGNFKLFGECVSDFQSISKFQKIPKDIMRRRIAMRREERNWTPMSPFSNIWGEEQLQSKQITAQPSTKRVHLIATVTRPKMEIVGLHRLSPKYLELQVGGSLNVTKCRTAQIEHTSQHRFGWCNENRGGGEVGVMDPNSNCGGAFTSSRHSFLLKEVREYSFRSHNIMHYKLLKDAVQEL